MVWHAERSRLKLTGHPSTEQVTEIFASSLVDIAYVAEASPEAVYIVADDPDWPADPTDFEWLCTMIRDTLAEFDIEDIILSMVPAGEQEPSASQGTVFSDEG